MGKVLFDYGASHSFVAASCEKDLGLEVETLEKPLYVNSPIGTKVSIDIICRDCELEISLRDFAHCRPSGHGHVRV